MTGVSKRQQRDFYKSLHGVIVLYSVSKIESLYLLHGHEATMFLIFEKVDSQK